MSWAAVAVGVGTVAAGSAASNEASKSQGQATGQALAAEGAQYDQNRIDSAPYRNVGKAAVGRLSDMLGLGGVPDENDPRYQAIKNQIVSAMDADHQSKYGMSIFDPRSGLSAMGGKSQFDDDVRNAATQQYTQQYGSQTTPSSGELTKKFTVQDFMDDPVTKLGYESGLKEGTTALDRIAGASGMRNSGATLKALTRFGQDYSGQKAGESYNRFYGDQDRTFNRLSGLAGTGQTAATNNAAMGSATTGRVSDLISSQGNARGAAAISKGNAFSGGLNTVGNWWNQNQMVNRMFPQQPGYTSSPALIPGYGG